MFPIGHLEEEIVIIHRPCLYPREVEQKYKMIAIHPQCRENRFCLLESVWLGLIFDPVRRHIFSFLSIFSFLGAIDSQEQAE